MEAGATLGNDQSDIQPNQSSPIDQSTGDTENFASIYSAQDVWLTTPTSFRLISLLPGTFEDPIVCGLRTSDLEHKPSYEAVSYVWGSENDHSTVICNGTPLLVSRNLVDGLRRFRDPQETRTLWADGVCIDQRNSIKEKNHQVRLMGRIYREAVRVLIWLGEDHGDMHLALKCCKALGNIYLFREQAEEAMKLIDTRMGFEPDVLWGSDEHKLKVLMEVVELPSPSSPEVAALQRLYQNPWFQRAWTFQEAHFAKERHWLRGPIQFDLHQAIHGEMVLRNLTKCDAYLDYNAYGVLWSNHTPRAVQLFEDSKLSMLLRLRRGSACTNPRDIVYSLLDAADIHDMVVDYNLPWTEVFSHATCKIIQQQGTLDFLGDVGCRDLSQVSELPTWLPDWRETLKRRGSFHQNYAPPADGFSRSEFADANTNVTRRLYGCSAPFAPIYSVSPNGMELQVAGAVLGMVDKLESPSRMPGIWRTCVIRWGQADETSDERRYARALIRLLSADTASFETTNDSPLTKRWSSSTDQALEALQTNIRLGMYFGPSAEQIRDCIHGKVVMGIDSRGDRSSFGGMAPERACIGDYAVVLIGCSLPALLRPTKDGKFLFVGLCYIDDVMDGQALDLIGWPASKETFKLNTGDGATDCSSAASKRDLRTFAIV